MNKGVALGCRPSGSYNASMGIGIGSVGCTRRLTESSAPAPVESRVGWHDLVLQAVETDEKPFRWPHGLEYQIVPPIKVALTQH